VRCLLGLQPSICLFLLVLLTHVFFTATAFLCDVYCLRIPNILLLTWLPQPRTRQNDQLQKDKIFELGVASCSPPRTVLKMRGLLTQATLIPDQVFDHLV